MIIVDKATMDRLNAMQYFLRVAELGSFAAVAEQADVARSVITRQIAALEAHLDCKLITRSTRRLTLTAAGAAYLEKCRVILNLVDDAKADLVTQGYAVRGPIRIALPLSFGLKRVAPILLEFIQRYPEITLDMDYSDRRISLIEEGVDLSIRVTRALAPGDVVRKLGSCRMKIVASPAYLTRHGRPSTPADLSHHEYLAYSLSGRNHLEFMTGEALQRIPVRGKITANNGDLLVAAAVAGMGITSHPDFIVDDEIDRGRLEEILADHPQPALGIYAVLASNRHIPHRLRVLLDFLATRLSPSLSPAQ